MTIQERGTGDSQQSKGSRSRVVQAPPPLPSLPAPVDRQLGDRNDSKLGIPWLSTVTLRYDCLTALRVPSSRHMHACFIPCHA